MEPMSAITAAIAVAKFVGNLVNRKSAPKRIVQPQVNAGPTVVRKNENRSGFLSSVQDMGNIINSFRNL